MAESACLMRSFSHPSDASREFREGDPMRALTESISFGRYMVEPLAWEKWSSFSRNRHLEEIEKFAKPGSVAEKKAYFEAHYRKKHAMKETPPSNTEEANAATCTIQMPECCSSTSTTEPELVAEEKLLLSDEQIKEDDSAEAVADSTDQLNVPTTEISKSEIVEASGTESSGQDDSAVAVADFTDQLNVPTAEISKSEIVEASGTESSGQDLIKDDLSQHEEKLTVVDDPKCANSMTSLEEKITDKISGSYNEKKEQKVVSSSKLLTRSRPSRLLLPDAKEIKSTPPRKGNYHAVQIKEKKSVANASDKKKLASRSVHMSMNFGSSNVGPSKAMSPVKPVANSSDKKKLASRSVHMSMNFGSSNVGPSKAMSPVLKQIKKIKDITASLKLQRESLVSRKTPSRVSVDLKPNLSSVDFKLKAKLTSVLEESETRRYLHCRTRSLQNRTATGGSIPSKSSNLHSKENSKPPSANAIKPQAPPIACTPFRFRSEERAAKRKAFFQKQEEKRNSNDAEKIQIHGSCKKTRARSQSPKFTQKPQHSTTQDTKSQKKTLSNANNESSLIKTNSSRRSMRASAMSAPRKTVHENASPNIQRQTLQGR